MKELTPSWNCISFIYIGTIPPQAVLEEKK